MSELILVTGGARSGKSTYALRAGESRPGPRTFVATCPVAYDAELDARIKRHRQDRDPQVWNTIEEMKDLAGLIPKLSDQKVVLIDCLTLWLYNFMRQAKNEKRSFLEPDAKSLCEELLQSCARHPGTVIICTNELGSGIVPVVQAGRFYRDMVGRCNQIVARAASQVVLMVCGQTLRIKG